MPISEAISNDIGVGGVLSLLWFRRRLPNWATKFIEMVLMVSADHGPAVSGNYPRKGMLSYIDTYIHTYIDTLICTLIQADHGPAVSGNVMCSVKGIE